MRQALRLGARLAWSVTGAARVRSLAMSVVALIATVLLLVTAALARASWQRLHENSLGGAGIRSQVRADDVLTVILVVVALGLSVGTLVATTSQLSVRLREQRLANLRLLGMTPAHTRLVAVVEVGAFAALGWLAGAALFVPLRPLLARIQVGGEPYPLQHLRPHLLDHLLVALLVPGLVIALSVLRRSRHHRDLVQAGRRGIRTRPGWWRLVPLGLGAALCLWVVRVTDAARQADESVAVGTGQITVLVSGLVLTGIGMLLVVPVFVRLVADLLSRAQRPALLLAGRRLQAQPLAMTRIVSALLIGLFLATSTFAIVAAYRSTPQFERTHRMATVEQVTQLTAEPGEVVDVVAAAGAVDEVRRVAAIHWAETDCAPGNTAEEAMCWTRAWIGTCEDLLAAVPEASGCRGDIVQEIGYGRTPGPSAPAAAELTLWAQGYELGEPADATVGGEFTVRPPRGPSAVVPLPSGPTIQVPEWGASFFGSGVFVPSRLPGVDALVDATPAEVRVVAGPGRDLFQTLSQAGLSPTSWESFSEYDRVIWMGHLVSGLSLLFVTLGILSFGVAAVDRAVERRREVISLQLVGAPGRVLRTSQWIEVALPLLLGCALAIWLGLLVGDAFLGLAVSGQLPPVGLGQLWPALLAAVIGSLVVGLITSLAANPRIRAELIRRE